MTWTSFPVEFVQLATGALTRITCPLCDLHELGAVAIFIAFSFRSLVVQGDMAVVSKTRTIGIPQAGLVLGTAGTTSGRTVSQNEGTGTLNARGTVQRGTCSLT